MANPLGSAPSIILGVGLGAAASTAIEPVVESARQTAWTNNRVRILTPELYAALVAQGAITLDAGRIQSHLEGLTDDKFDGLVHLALRTPTYAEAQDLRRRDRISDAQLRHTFAKAQIEEQYWDALAALVDERLSPQVVALAVVRGLLPNMGILPVAPPTEQGSIPSFPVQDIDPFTEAAAGGIDSPRLKVLAGIAGRPPGPELMARANFRRIIELTDYYRAIAEGDIRNEWRDAILEVSREILTASQYAELELRGFLTADERRALTDLHGMSHTNSDLLVDMQGRSISVHQVTTGLARGGKYPGSYANVPDPYKSAIQRSNIREEYAELDYVNRYTYPTGFQIKAEATAGDLGEKDTEALLLELGWNPKWAAFFAKAWAAKAAGVAVDPWIKKADNQLWTATHKAYKGNAIDQTQARERFDLIGIPASAQTAVLARWDSEKTL